MKTCPVVSVMCFSGFDGGMELDAIKLAHLLSESCEVSLLCKQGSFIHDRVRQEQAFDVVPVNFHSRRFSPAMIRQVRHHIRQNGVNNAVFFGASELKSLYFAFLGLDINVIVRHGTTKSHRKDGLIHRLIYSCVDHHVALSKHLLNNVRYIIPSADEHNSSIIMPSFDMRSPASGYETRHETGQHDHLYITHIGRMAEGKGQVDAVKACAALSAAGIEFELHLLGGLKPDSYCDSLKALVDNCEYRDRVFLEGFSDDTSSFLQRSDIFLFPSAGEGMPNAFIEALHHGVICIAYDNTVFPEYIELGFHVHLVADGDVDGLSATLVRLARTVDDELARSRANIELAGELFQPSRELSDWLSLLVNT